ncbi:HlyD family efflux transporter periplasmic adaptor subunit [Nitrospira sp. M1]
MAHASQHDSALPPLRNDLQIVKGPPTLQGEPTWTIIDPVANRYIQIGWTAYHMLNRWTCGTVQRLMEKMESETTASMTTQDITDLILFLHTNHLTQAPHEGGNAAFVAQAEAAQQHWLMWIIHHYLFFKIPLARPDRFLQATLPYVRPLMTSTAGMIVSLIGATGLIMVSRQWETFTKTFVHMFTLEGILAFGLALCGIKVLHELAHAYRATQYGCRIHTMGVAMLVMFPVLYTDTTDTWRLTERKERLTIAAAGVTVELMVAMLATFLWNFLPDGIFRSVAFTLATTSWLLSLTINLNPFLRFDGYYFLSDWLGVPNLQMRAFAFGRWKLREWIFGIGIAPPEVFSPRMRSILIIYTWSVWIFRFLLFLGIALLVYHFFFKLLGVILFIVEIVWFILWPIGHELREWWNLKAEIARTPRAWLSGIVLVLLTMAMCIPWNTRVAIPAILQAQHHTTIFSPAPGRLLHTTMQNGQAVTHGELLANVESPQLEHDILQTRQQLTALQLRLKRLTSHTDHIADKAVVIEELKTRRSELEGLLERQEQLAITSPFSGIVMDVQTSLHSDRWIDESLPLARVIDPTRAELLALAPEHDLARLAVGQEARFIPDDPMRSIRHAHIREIREVDEDTLIIPYLASVFGGNIAVREDADGNLHPETAIYRVTLVPTNKHVLDHQVIKGMLHISGQPKSLLTRVGDTIIPVLLKELSW